MGKKKGHKTWTQAEYEVFVQRWQESECVQDVADLYGLQLQTIANRAANLRKVGVRLKKMKSSRPRIDWKALAELAESFE